MLKFQRSVHTRAKKVSVQLLKDFEHVGVRGEVVQVTEGLMRNKLHPRNGAAYMVDGPQIPIVKRQQVVRATKIQPQAKVVEKKAPSILDMLVFDVEEGSEPTPKTQAKEQRKESKDGAATDFEWQNEFVKTK